MEIISVPIYALPSYEQKCDCMRIQSVVRERKRCVATADGVYISLQTNKIIASCALSESVTNAGIRLIQGFLYCQTGHYRPRAFD